MECGLKASESCHWREVGTRSGGHSRPALREESTLQPFRDPAIGELDSRFRGNDWPSEWNSIPNYAAT